jgi:tetraacyldisaccharide 4'-kinase
MRLDTPFWWYRKRGVLASMLAPLGTLYGRMAEKRFAKTAPYRSKLPVICIGTVTAGGGGKTPTAIALAKGLKNLGETPVFLTRGYGGKAAGPILVEAKMPATEIGDEPLLLTEHAPVVVAADRAAGAKFIEGSDLGATVIVMDDGFQNNQLAKDLALIVVDAGAGIGNGLVMPAGPLRGHLPAQLGRADALLVIGDGDKAEPLAKHFAAQGKPVLKANLKPRGDTRWLGVLPVIGFAGIANPGKFYKTLAENGARLKDTCSFPDHHNFSEKEAAGLLRAAEDKKAMLVTTEKDWVRLPDGDGTSRGELRFRSRPLPVAIEFGDPEAVKALVERALKTKRSSGG